MGHVLLEEAGAISPLGRYLSLSHSFPCAEQLARGDRAGVTRRENIPAPKPGGFAGCAPPAAGPDPAPLLVENPAAASEAPVIFTALLPAVTHRKRWGQRSRAHFWLSFRAARAVPGVWEGDRAGTAASCACQPGRAALRLPGSVGTAARRSRFPLSAAHGIAQTSAFPLGLSPPANHNHAPPARGRLPAALTDPAVATRAPRSHHEAFPAFYGMWKRCLPIRSRQGGTQRAEPGRWAHEHPKGVPVPKSGSI